MGDRFKLYIITSSKCLDELYKIILEHAPSGLDVGPMREIFTREKETGIYKKSNRKFILTTEDVYNMMKEDGFTNDHNKSLYINEYEIRSDNKAPRDSTMHYFFPNFESNRLSIIKKLEFIRNMGLFTSDDYAIHDGIVEFSDIVSLRIRIIVKILIDTKECRVSWCKKHAFNKINHAFK
jgi:hypothetical protein